MSAQKIFVGNLNYRTTEHQLKSYFRDVGGVVSARVVSDPATGRSRGFGFVEFETEADARMAVDVFDGRRLAGRTIQVRPANDTSSPRRKRQPRLLAQTRDWDSGETDDRFEEVEPRDHKHHRAWRDMRRSKRSL